MKATVTRKTDSTVSPRLMAADVLTDVETGAGFAESLLDRALSRHSFSSVRDRGLLTALVYGTLRMRGRLDWIIRHFYRGDYDRMECGIRNILRSALYQALFTERIPDFAVVNEAVKITRRRYLGRERLVNGILRNALRGMNRVEFPERTDSLPDYIAVFHSHPRWLVDMWMSELGDDETERLCAANTAIPPFTVRVNRIKTSPEEVMTLTAREAGTTRRGDYSPDALHLSDRSGAPGDWSLVANGMIQIQDEASQLVSYLVAPEPGERVLDLCAGAGIKTIHMAALMENRGTITAVDISAGKGDMLRELAARQGAIIIDTVTADATSDLGAPFHGAFDRVLVDAPCSGTGTLRRNPEIKWRLAEDDIRRLAILQGHLMDAAAAYTARGGYLVYSTCAISRRENDECIHDFMTRNGNFELVQEHKNMSAATVGGDGLFRTCPHRHGTDGFFGAVMKKIS